MSPHTFLIEAQLWKYSSTSAWYFVTLPPTVAEQIRPLAPKVGFRSVRVTVTVGETTWKTSLFPDTKSNSYLLPMKADVRRREALNEGDEVVVFLEW
jgi:Domain of unknown function (DUF1905)